jgi:hypothetical protein
MQNSRIRPNYHIDLIRINSKKTIHELSSILNLPVLEDHCKWVIETCRIGSTWPGRTSEHFYIPGIWRHPRQGGYSFALTAFPGIKPIRASHKGAKI